jgi:hydrogenase-1 operon protein HyaF
MSDYPLVWYKKPPVSTEAPLRLLDMPIGQSGPRRESQVVDRLGPAARTLFDEMLAALHRHAAGAAGSTRVALRALEADDRHAVLDLLGEGDVLAELGGPVNYRISETVLAGVWHVTATDAAGVQTDWLEVGPIPQAVVNAAERMPRNAVDIPERLPQGAMNSLALLAELNERSAGWTGEGENHVINFTLLPITEADAEVITAVLGQLPLVIRGGGYGSCRIFATGLRHVWAVQYLNSMGKVILDTLEVGGVPVAAIAAREDFEDSARRLVEMMEAYA